MMPGGHRSLDTFERPIVNSPVGINGAGNMGGALEKVWAKVGHDVMFSFHHDAAKLAELAKSVGANARAGRPADVAQFRRQPDCPADIRAYIRNVARWLVGIIIVASKASEFVSRHQRKMSVAGLL